MSTTIAEMAVSVVARTAKFSKGMASARKITKTFASRLTSLGKGAAAFGGILTGVSIGGMAMFIRGQLDAIDSLAKTAHSLGMTTEALGGLQHAAELTGVSNDQLATALKRMEKTVSDASVGLSTAKRALGQLGLSVEQFRGLQAEQQFALIGDALKGVSEQTDRARIAQDIFGRSGIALVNTLKLGSRGLADLAAEAKALGLTFTDEQAAKVEEFNDQMTRLKGLIGGLGRKFVIDVAPAAAEAIQGLVLIVQQWNKLQGKAAGIRDSLKGQFNYTGQVLGAVSRVGKRIADPLFQGIDTNQGATANNFNSQFAQPFSKETADRLLRSQEKQTEATVNMAEAFADDPWVTKALP